MFKKRIFTALVLSLFVAATLIVCWPLVEPVYARTIAVVTDNLGNFTGPQTGAAQNDNVKGSLDLMHGKILPSANATCWYVDSGISGQTAGDSWSTAVATIEAAVALASAEDWILVAPGHNEAMEAADEIDLDKAGLVLLGFGNGAKKPTLDYDNANGELVIGADSVTVQNIRFRVSANSTTLAIDVEDAGDNFAILDCEFGYAETATDEFSATIVISGADDGRIERCKFDSGAQAAVTAISFENVTGLLIKDNKIFGDYSTAIIHHPSTNLPSNEVFIEGNILYQGTLGGDGEINNVAVLNIGNNTSGFVDDNRIVANTTCLLNSVADDMTFGYNVSVHTDGDEFEGALRSAGSSVTASAGANG